MKFTPIEDDINHNAIDFTKPILSEDGFPTVPTVEFTDDEWKSIYIGKCIEKSYYSYLIESKVYGTFWIGKMSVRLKK